MKTIYVDDLFLLNLAINYFILLATAKLCALPYRRLRFGLGAAFGGIYAVLVLLPGMNFLAQPILKLALGAAITLIAFGDAKKILKPFVAFLAVSAAFGGAIFAISMLGGGSLEGGFYINADLKVLLLSFAICYFSITLVFDRLVQRRGRETMAVRIELCGKSVEFTALRDTGNQLFDPVSGLPVMVAGRDAAAALLPPFAFEALNRGATELLQSLGQDAALGAKFRLVPYSALGLKMALLPVFRPDVLIINGKAEKNLLVGLSPMNLCKDGDFSAVI
ncbi:MAG: sigma-E processing peptidase SpoIIGA [Oscillospiraceae bacterium]